MYICLVHVLDINFDEHLLDYVQCHLLLAGCSILITCSLLCYSACMKTR